MVGEVMIRVDAQSGPGAQGRRGSADGEDVEQWRRLGIDARMHARGRGKDLVGAGEVEDFDVVENEDANVVGHRYTFVG